MGCTQPTVPEPEPDPVKVYLTDNGETFTRVDTAGTFAYADIYQWDGEGQMYTGDDVEVEFDATYGTEWTITVGGAVYLNDANIGILFLSSDTSFYTDVKFEIEEGVVYEEKGTGVNFALFTASNPDGNTFTYLGEGRFKVDFWTGDTVTWTLSLRKRFLPNNGETFGTQSSNATIRYYDIYQLDSDEDGLVDSPAKYFIQSYPEDVEVVFNATYNTDWTILVGGNVYLNNKNLKSWTCATNPTEIVDIYAGGAGIRIEHSAVFYSLSDISYNGDGTITFMGLVFN
jgi:hypothetical protein